MSKNIYDMKRTAIDRTAARVTGPGVGYVPAKKIGNAADSDYLAIMTPKEMNPVVRKEVYRWRGHRFGRMTVVGLSADVPKRWVVRCDCGIYTLRKLKAIKNSDNGFDCCQHCRHLLFLKREEHYRRTGKDEPVSYFYS